MNNNYGKRMQKLTLPLLILFVVSFGFFVDAAPQGSQITSNVTVTSSSSSPDNRTDDGGTITTLVLDTLQQDQSWKGYVGNVTGRLTLDDADGFTIYDWDFVNITITGEVYAARVSSPDFDTVECANTTTIADEETFHNMSGSDADSITNTFNYTLHDAFSVGTISGGSPNSILVDTCPSTATYMNDSVQVMNDSSTVVFQEILLQDGSSNVLFVSILEDDYQAYRADGTTHDFQMILPESDVKPTATTYYFFLEIN